MFLLICVDWGYEEAHAKAQGRVRKRKNEARQPEETNYGVYGEAQEIGELSSQLYAIFLGTS